MKPYILVVDDDKEIARLITDYLEQQGYKVTSCNDAKQALIQAQSVRVGLLILDIMMPGFGSGIDAYESIRSNSHFSKNLPIIFLTGLKPAEAEKLVPKDDPFVRLLHKPTSITVLQNTMNELFAAVTLSAKGQGPVSS